MKKCYSDSWRPEYRVPLMLPGGLLVPVGLFIYGWTAHYTTHWIGPNIGAVVFATGLIIGFQCAQAYVLDALTGYAASASGAAAFVLTLAGFNFPLFAPAMYKSLGLACGNSLLAFISIGLGIPVPILLWNHGHLLRARSINYLLRWMSICSERTKRYGEVYVCWHFSPIRPSGFW